MVNDLSRPKSSRRRTTVVAMLLLIFVAPALRAARAEGVTADQVRRSIERAVTFLSREQRTDGTWPDRKQYAGGLTPLCTLALLNAGQKTADPVVKRALDQVRLIQPKSTYTTALQTMVLCAAEPEADRALVLRNVRWLETRQVAQGPQAGMWSIPSEGSPDHIDNSMTHMAMLALHEAELIGISVNPKVWQRALDYWKQRQNLDGSWGWGPGYPGTGSMTCAGIAVVTIAETRLHEGDAIVRGDVVTCCQTQEENSTVERAFDWLARNFSVRRNPGMKFWLSYYLYSLERVGRMTSRRLIGGHDWYREGAAFLIREQLFSGAWPSDMDSDEYTSDPCISTSFCVMFLSKARRPLIIGHVRHEPKDDWNHHRRSLSQLVRYAEQAWKQDLTYQVVDLSAASVEELLGFPVLFLSGRERLEFSNEDWQKLRMYVDRGGFIFAEQCCEGTAFGDAFRNVLKELYPDSELKPLSPGHPIWFAEKTVMPNAPLELWGLDTGCRTGIVYSPQDLSCLWELMGRHEAARYAQTVAARMESARNLGVNVLAYATDRNVRFKDPALPLAEPAGHEANRGAISIATIAHGGGCDVARNVPRTLGRIAQEQLKIRVKCTDGELLLSDPAILNQQLLLIHGRRAFTLTKAERRQLREYVERGGIVLADALCASREFDESLRREMQATFPERSFEPVPARHPLFTSELGGNDISSVQVRLPPKIQEGGKLESTLVEREPRLEGIRVGDHYGVLYSPIDLSCAIEAQGMLNCEGYTTLDAIRIALNVLLYALH